MALCKAVLGLVLVALVSAAHAQGSLTCGTVASKISPCLGYLRGKAGAVPAPCCMGARSLNDMTKTTPDRQQACKCLKTFAGNVPGINPGLAEMLPKNCGFTSPYRISLSTDCSRVQ